MLNNPNLWFAFVDLKEFKGLPDTFIVPSRVVFTSFKAGDPKTWIRASITRYLTKWRDTRTDDSS
jgi:hypothetical protein